MDSFQQDKQDTDQSKLMEGSKFVQQSKMRGGPQEQIPHQMNVQPGYTKFVIDEHKADYDYIKGKFTDDEIKEAFSTLDINKTKHITKENLTFFLEYLGEKATDQEVDEMVKMCDIDGNGEVSYDEFYKLATGQSLAPIGQAYTPSPEMQQKREKLEQLMKDENDSFYNTQVQNKQKKLRQQMRQQQQLQQNELNGMSQDLNMQQQLGITQKSQMVGKSGMMQSQMQSQQFQNNTMNQSSVKINSFFMGGPGSKETAQNQSRINDYLGTVKQIISQRQKLFKKLVKDQGITGNKIRVMVDQYMKGTLDADIHSYQEFARFFQISEDSKLLIQLYNNLIDIPQQDDQQQQTGNQILYPQDLLLMLLGSCQEIPTDEKYGIAFDLIKEEKITKEHVFQMVFLMTFKPEIDQLKLEQKIKAKFNSGSYKKFLNPNEINRALFLDLINSFPTYFY